MLYRALCDHAANDEAITGMLQSAAACGEQLTQYPKEWVLAAAVTDLPPSLRLYYMKFYLPLSSMRKKNRPSSTTSMLSRPQNGKNCPH